MSRRRAGGALGAILLAASTLSIRAAAAAERVWRISWFSLGSPPASPEGSPHLQAFRSGLSELGYTEARDYVIEASYADTDRGRLPRLAKELVDARVDIIVTVGTPTTVAAKRATSTIPIIMTAGENPVGRGLIASFNRPGGNVTGLTHSPDPHFMEKGLQLLKHTAPNITRVAVLTSMSPDGFAPRISAAEGLGIALLRYDLGEVENVEHLDALLKKIVGDNCDATFVFPEFKVGKFRNEIGEFLIKNPNNFYCSR
jgi:putative ABC transport system substrate-binding protein